MASKRKSTTPCMVRTSEVVEQEGAEGAETPKDKGSGGTQQDSKNTWPSENSVKDCEVVEAKPAGENQSKKPQGGYEWVLLSCTVLMLKEKCSLKIEDNSIFLPG